MTLNGLKVYVTPNIAAGKFVVGVNDGDFAASAAVALTQPNIVIY